MLNISYLKQYFVFFGNKFKFNSLLPVLTFLFYFSIIASVIGTGMLNITIIFFNIIFIFFLFSNKDKIEFHFNKIIFFLTIAFLLLNIFSSIESDRSFYGTLNLLKNLVFLIGGYTIFKLNKNVFKNFISLTLIIFILVGLDTLLQYFLGKDIFGYVYSQTHGGRLSGPFGDEWIVGSFLSKILFLSIIYFLYNYERKFYDIIFLFISITIIFLTNERSAILMTLFSSFIYLFFRFKNLKVKVIFFSSLILITIFFSSIPSIKNQLIIKSLEQIGLKDSSWNSDDQIFLDSQWGAHYLTAISIFKNNPIFGSGLKTFRYECQNEEYNNINSKSSNARCSSHPHNFYLEILSDTGIIGLGLFIYLLFWVFLNIIKAILDNKKNAYITLVIFFLFFWPIKTTGSIFASWNSYFYILALLAIITQLNLIKININDK